MQSNFPNHVRDDAYIDWQYRRLLNQNQYKTKVVKS